MAIMAYLSLITASSTLAQFRLGWCRLGNERLHSVAVVSFIHWHHASLERCRVHGASATPRRLCLYSLAGCDHIHVSAPKIGNRHLGPTWIG